MDVARLLDGVVRQNEMVGQLVAEIEALRAELEQVRAERLVTTSLQELQTDIKSGGSVKQYRAELKFRRRGQATGSGEAQGFLSRDASEGSARRYGAALGTIHALISGASLSGDHTEFDENRVVEAVRAAWKEDLAWDHSAEGHIEIGEYVHESHRRG